MRFLVAFLACCLVLSATSVALAAPTLADAERAALAYVLASENYIANGGFDEKVLRSGMDEKTAEVVIEYRTRHVGMLQMIGHFLSYVTLDSNTLEVLGCITEESYESVDPVEPGNWTEPDPGPDPDPDPDLEPGYQDEGYRLKISYLINETMARIYVNSAQNDLPEAINMLDRAWELLGRGEYDSARDMASRAEELVNEYLYGGNGEEPGEKPGEKPGVDPADMPWLYGYIVIFDHDPAEDDWDELLSAYNATYMGEASGYTEEANAYWVRAQGTSAEDLLVMEGVKDVLALRGGPEPSDGETAVPEMLALPGVVAAGVVATRRLRKSQ